MRCANRTSVEDRVACSAMSILSPSRELRFHLLGENGGSSEAPDQLLPAFRAPLDAALIDQSSSADVPVAARDDAAAVNIWQQILAIRNPAAAMRLPRLCRPAIGRLDPNYFT